ncbi:MAG TPA: heavy metal translocating P-type ATPase [Bacteroidota bacterium]|nr:heavy metal translocating P-type ATPase [Bacteroidota bacterium]
MAPAPAASATEDTCALCALRLPRRPHRALHEGEELLFCCTGCRKVFLLLAESGLLGGDFRSSELYRTSLRLGIIGRPDDEPAPPPGAAGEDCAEVVYHIDGMWCSSCSWLIEKVAAAHPGVASARVLYASDTARITYRPGRTAPASIAAAIEKLGYRVSSPADEPDARAMERRALLVKMGVALFLMNNVMFFSYTLYVGYFQELAREMKLLVPLILLGLTIPSVFWCGLPIHRKAWAGLRNGAPTMELLFSIGIFASFFYSVHTVLTGGLAVYFDTSASLVALLLVGKFLEMSAKHRAAEGVTRLHRMLPAKVRISTPGGERLVAADRLAAGDVFIVKAGEKIPADGVIVAGSATVDESLLTGESRPVPRRAGDRVVASSIATGGHITVRATSVGDATLLAGIVRMVEGALAARSPLERTVDRIARVFIPAVLLCAAGACIVLFLATHNLEGAMLRAVTVLVIACPCVLGMATPLAVVAGVGRAAGRGILIRDAESLERTASATVAVFDKTGTLTEGRFALRGTQGPIDEREVLRYLGALERYSSHPLGEALVRECVSRGIAPGDACGVRMEEGRGIAGCVEGTDVAIGTEAFIRDAGYAVSGDIAAFAGRERADGKTITYYGIGGRGEAGVCLFGDEIRAGAREAVAALRALGVRVVLLSGDARDTVEAVGSRAGIEERVADVLPAGKVEFIRRLQSAGERVMMVGDGVNDAPALARADVGLAMGSGTSMALGSAGVSLLRDDPALVPETIATARRTVRVIRQNLAWAFFYNAIGLVLALAGLLNPLIAAGAMVTSSLTVVLNSMRLREKEGRAMQLLLDILVPWRERDS